MSKKRTSLFLALSMAVALGLASCGGGSTEPKARAEKATVAVTVETVKLQLVSDPYDAVGTIRPRSSSVLSSKVMGQVLAIGVRQGDQVRAGQVLVEIDNRDAAANLAKAQAGLSEAQNALAEVEESMRAAEAGKEAADAAANLAASTFKRYQALLERKSVSQQEFDEVEFKHKAAVAEARRAEQMRLSVQARRLQALDRIAQAKAEIRNAEAYMSYTKVTAPFSGVIAVKHIEPGALSAPGVPLLTLENNRDYQLEAAVEESRIAKIKLGDRVPVLIDAIGGRELTGAVSEIVPAADPSSRSFTVKIRLSETDGIRSGMFGRARFPAGQRELLLVPASSVVARGQLTGVMVVDEAGTARFRLIKTGKRYAERLEVLSGLTPGDRVVVEQPQKIQDGNPVTVREA